MTTPNDDDDTTNSLLDELHDLIQVWSNEYGIDEADDDDPRWRLVSDEFYSRFCEWEQQGEEYESGDRIVWLPDGFEAQSGSVAPIESKTTTRTTTAKEQKKNKQESNLLRQAVVLESSTAFCLDDKKKNSMYAQYKKRTNRCLDAIRDKVPNNIFASSSPHRGGVDSYKDAADYISHNEIPIEEPTIEDFKKGIISRSLHMERFYNDDDINNHINPPHKRAKHEYFNQVLEYCLPILEKQRYQEVCKDEQNEEANQENEVVAVKECQTQDECLQEAPEQRQRNKSVGYEQIRQQHVEKHLVQRQKQEVQELVVKREVNVFQKEQNPQHQLLNTNTKKLKKKNRNKRNCHNATLPQITQQQDYLSICEENSEQRSEDVVESKDLPEEGYLDEVEQTEQQQQLVYEEYEEYEPGARMLSLPHGLEAQSESFVPFENKTTTTAKKQKANEQESNLLHHAMALESSTAFCSDNNKKKNDSMYAQYKKRTNRCLDAIRHKVPSYIFASPSRHRARVDSYKDAADYISRNEIPIEESVIKDFRKTLILRKLIMERFYNDDDSNSHMNPRHNRAKHEYFNQVLEYCLRLLEKQRYQEVHKDEQNEEANQENEVVEVKERQTEDECLQEPPEQRQRNKSIGDEQIRQRDVEKHLVQRQQQEEVQELEDEREVNVFQQEQNPQHQLLDTNTKTLKEKNRNKMNCHHATLPQFTQPQNYWSIFEETSEPSSEDEVESKDQPKECMLARFERGVESEIKKPKHYKDNRKEQQENEREIVNHEGDEVGYENQAQVACLEEGVDLIYAQYKKRTQRCLDAIRDKFPSHIFESSSRHDGGIDCYKDAADYILQNEIPMEKSVIKNLRKAIKLRELYTERFYKVDNNDDGKHKYFLQVQEYVLERLERRLQSVIKKPKHIKDNRKEQQENEVEIENHEGDEVDYEDQAQVACLKYTRRDEVEQQNQTPASDKIGQPTFEEKRIQKRQQQEENELVEEKEVIISQKEQILQHQLFDTDTKKRRKRKKKKMKPNCSNVALKRTLQQSNHSTDQDTEQIRRKDGSSLLQNEDMNCKYEGIPDQQPDQNPEASRILQYVDIDHVNGISERNEYESVIEYVDDIGIAVLSDAHVHTLDDQQQQYQSYVSCWLEHREQFVTTGNLNEQQPMASSSPSSLPPSSSCELLATEIEGNIVRYLDRCLHITNSSTDSNIEMSDLVYCTYRKHIYRFVDGINRVVSSIGFRSITFWLLISVDYIVAKNIKIEEILITDVLTSIRILKGLRLKYKEDFSFYMNDNKQTQWITILEYCWARLVSIDTNRSPRTDYDLEVVRPRTNEFLEAYRRSSILMDVESVVDVHDTVNNTPKVRPKELRDDDYAAVSDQIDCILLLDTLNDLMKLISVMYSGIKSDMERNDTIGYIMKRTAQAAEITNRIIQLVTELEESFAKDHPCLNTIYRVLVVIMLPDHIEAFTRIIRNISPTYSHEHLYILVNNTFANGMNHEFIERHAIEFFGDLLECAMCVDESTDKHNQFPIIIEKFLKRLNIMNIEEKMLDNREALLEDYIRNDLFHYGKERGQYLYEAINRIRPDCCSAFPFEYIGKNRSILGTMKYLQLFSSYVQANTKEHEKNIDRLLSIQDSFGSSQNKLKYNEIKFDIRNSMESLLMNEVLPSLANICGDESCPIDSLPLIYQVKSFMKQPDLPITWSLSFSIHAILTSILEIKSTKNDNFNCLVQGVRAECLGYWKQMKVLSALRWQKLPCMNNRDLMNRLIGKLSDDHIMTGAWNPLCAGTYLLYTARYYSSWKNGSTMNYESKTSTSLPTWYEALHRSCSYIDRTTTRNEINDNAPLVCTKPTTRYAGSISSISILSVIYLFDPTSNFMETTEHDRNNFVFCSLENLVRVFGCSMHQRSESPGTSLYRSRRRKLKKPVDDSGDTAASEANNDKMMQTLPGPPVWFIFLAGALSGVLITLRALRQK